MFWRHTILYWSKTSTSFYLGYSGIRTANVPLIPDVAPPRELLELDRDKVIGLTINQRRLKTIREVRARALGRHVQDSYANEKDIVREIRYANELIARNKWRSVDVSYKAIEEVAKQVAELRGLRLKMPE